MPLTKSTITHGGATRIKNNAAIGSPWRRYFLEAFDSFNIKLPLRKLSPLVDGR
jgi:hypothetical protein